ncbi:MAG: tetratricopeptide repeat protein [Sulfurovum sp.]|nr:tetratricopeptide repeat protein [Sulfurovum sp.]
MQNKKQLSKVLFLISLLASTITLIANDNKVACMKNDASACYAYALPLVSGENANIQDIREEGLNYIRKACVLGYHQACDVLGKNYFEDKSYIAARPHLEESCNRGVKVACESMGVIYRDGHDVRNDDVKAREFFTKACALKSPDACYNVAIIYRGGFGVTKSREKEKEFYKKGCDLGLKASCDRFTELDNEDKGIETGFIATMKAWFN